MKTRNFIAGLFILCALIFGSNYTSAQDDKGTFIEESGEKQDSTPKTDIFDFSGEIDKENSPSIGIVLLVLAVPLIGGGIFIFLRKKKKSKEA